MGADQCRTQTIQHEEHGQQKTQPLHDLSPSAAAAVSPVWPPERHEALHSFASMSQRRSSFWFGLACHRRHARPRRGRGGTIRQSKLALARALFRLQHPRLDGSLSADALFRAAARHASSGPCRCRAGSAAAIEENQHIVNLLLVLMVLEIWFFTMPP